jgi:uncharacterized protein YcbK (DUF882 family)
MRLSPYFLSEEFSCHDGTDVPDELMPNLERLVAVLDAIRLRWGGPLSILSGYRTPDYNRRIGGAKASTHMTAEGADIIPGRGFEVKELHDLILHVYRGGELPLVGGLGEYKGWVHVDVHKVPDGHLRRWKGKGVGSEQ